MTVLAYRYGEKTLVCCDCADTVSQYAQAQGEEITDEYDLFDVDVAGDPLQEYVTIYRCAECDKPLYVHKDEP